MPVQQTSEPVQITRDNIAAYVEEVNNLLNEENSHLSGTMQYDRAPMVANEIFEIIKLISDGVCAQNIPMAKKGFALGSLVHIGRMIIDANDTLGHEVQKGFQRDAALEDALSRIANSLTVEEVGLIRRAPGEIRELMERGAGYGLFTELGGVLDALSDSSSTDNTAEKQE